MMAHLNGANGPRAGVELLDLFPAKAQYRPGEAIGLLLEVENRTPRSLTLHFRVELWHLGERVAGGSEDELRVAPGRQRLSITLPPREEPLAGFGVVLALRPAAGAAGGELRAATAFDVAADEHARLRYGFLSDFDSPELGGLGDVEFLSKLHINFVQFYDWMYRHDELVSREERYTDPMGKRTDLAVVREKVAACHRHNMRAIAYGAVYAATQGFYIEHPDWALLHRDGTPYSFIERFYLMDIRRGSPWSRHIVGEYGRAIEEVGFDGIHMDTYGFPKTAFVRPRPREQATLVRLAEEFPYLIAAAREAVGAERTLIFNNVGAWPMERTGSAPQDAVYIEVWPPFVRYHHLAELIRRARSAGSGKAVVLAAYLEPFKGARTEGELERAEEAALLATAVITSFGASHLVLGEEGGVLMQAYYVDYARARPAFITRLRSYWDFIVRYGELFYDRTLEEVTSTHLGVEFPDYQIEGCAITQTGECGGVWTVIHESPRRAVISLINLVGVESDEWNVGHPHPEAQRGLILKARVPAPPARVYAASPELESGRPQPLEHRLVASFEEALDADAEPGTGTSEGNEVLVTRLPELQRWSVVVIELD